jgi:hypothetical protein
MATTEKPDTSPLRINGVIVQDGIQANLDTARRRYRREYDRGYLLSEQGHSEHAQRVLDTANSELLLAETKYAKARGRQ